jgi:hypothetical protein
MQLIFNSPLNPLSLGQVGFNLLREFYKRDYDVGWFPIGNTDLSAYRVDEKFVQWLQKSVNQRYSFLGKDIPSVSNWHLNGSEKVFGAKNLILTYHETDSATPVEKAIAANQRKVLFCGGFSESVFRGAGLENVGSFDLGFDEDFKPTGRKYLEGRIHFGLVGKWESRKNTERLIKLWAAKYGNNKKYSLSLLVNNPFYGSNPQETENINANFIRAALNGKNFWNINALPRLKTNAEVVDLTNSLDIDISCTGSEAWGLPSFNATCLGKWSVVLNSMGQKAWANEENSILVEQEGWRECYDDAFFKKGGDFSQGHFPYVSDEAIVHAFERAEEKVGTINQKGLDLGREFTYSRTVDQIVNNL